MRHALGVMGVLAAGVLLAVSAAMNWRFGLSLGTTEIDGQIYGAASAAADCMKALLPFFLFAAIRNRMWSQAVASGFVWVVVTGFSLTSAFGHAGLNRFDKAGQRTIEAQTYKDLRADLARAQEQLGWVPQHRPAQSIQAEVDGKKLSRPWRWTKECTQAKSKSMRTFCDGYHGLVSELASAEQAGALEVRIASIQDKLSGTKGGSVASEADPQAAVLAKLTGFEVEQVQLAMVVFIALLLEVGSSLGLYVAFSQWRMNDALLLPKPVAVSAQPIEAVPARTVAATVAASEVAALPKPSSGANDNRSVPAKRIVPLVPENDVERFYKERIETQDGSSLTATSLYEDYCTWCDEQQKEPLALPTFGREFGDLGVQKAKIAGRVRYIGIALGTGQRSKEDKKQLAFRAKAA